MLEVQLKCHFIQDPTVSAPELCPPLCTHSCTEQEGQWCLHVVTGSEDLEQGHREKKFKFILRRTGLMLRYSGPETPVRSHSETTERPMPDTVKGPRDAV